jgi:putative hydrolase of the HAD superfamily
VIKAVLFDLDNTLVDFWHMKDDAVDAALEAMRDAGLRMDKTKARKLLFKLYREHGIEYQRIFQLFLRKSIGKIDYKILAAGIHAYRKVKDAHMITYPSVKPVLTELKRRYKLGIISDAPSLQVWLRLTELGLTRFFDLVITPSETKARKPSGLPFKLAIRMLKLKPEQIAMVGDWPSRDIEPARKIGLVTVLARYGQTGKEKAKSDYVIDDIRELPGVLTSSQR